MYVCSEYTEKKFQIKFDIFWECLEELDFLCFFIQD